MSRWVSGVEWMGDAPYTVMTTLATTVPKILKDLILSKSSKDTMLISWLRGSFILVRKISFKIDDYLPHKIVTKNT